MDILIGLILPPIIEVLNKDVQNDDERYLVSLVICFLLAFALDWQYIVHFQLLNLLPTSLVIIGTAQMEFKLWFQNSSFRGKIQEVFNTANQNPRS